MANRQQIADWLNVPTNQVVYMDQVHGNKVVFIDKVPDEPTGAMQWLQQFLVLH
jgi:copper oxidase (laccase) domain-containing protein